MDSLGAEWDSGGFNLARFLDAQEKTEPDGRSVYDHVLEELQAGEKRTHWMWFIFPQATGLGVSVNSRHYGIASADEARAYLRHPVLAARLLGCCRLVLRANRSAVEILGELDALKLMSSMVLFASVSMIARFYEVLSSPALWPESTEAPGH